MKWILKAIVQKVISWLPGSHRINFLFQKYVTKGVQLSDQYFGDKLGHAIDHLRLFRQFGNQVSFNALELGTGWYPVVPIALHLGGAKAITSIDISPLLSSDSLGQTVNKYLDWHRQGKLQKLLPNIDPSKLKDLESQLAKNPSKEEWLNYFGLDLLIVDARSTGFEDNSFDLVCSNNTYEHIYPEILSGIISEFQRVVKTSGVNSHFIDMSDHFAHLDQSITIYNYLKFSNSQWKRIDNSVQPQNRLRLPDYEKMYAENGIEIVHREMRPGSLEDLAKVKVHSDIGSYEPKDIAVSHVHLISSK